MTLKVVGVDPKSYFNSDMLLHMKFKMLSKTEFWGFAPGLLWNSVGRSFHIARSNYVVTDYHIEHCANDNCTWTRWFEYFRLLVYIWRLLQSLEINYYRSVYGLSFYFRVSAKGLHKLISCWLILSKEWLFVLASVDLRSTCVDLNLLFDTYR
jgi:hypothetical protein